MFEAMIQAHFCAARRLLNYSGPCAQLHGHNFKVQAFVHTETLDAAGVCVDFEKINAALKPLIERLDHSDLNALPEFEGISPSTEFLCRYLFVQLQKSVPELSKITIWDTPNSCVSFTKSA